MRAHRTSQSTGPPEWLIRWVIFFLALVMIGGDLALYALQGRLNVVILGFGILLLVLGPRAAGPIAGMVNLPMFELPSEREPDSDQDQQDDEPPAPRRHGGRRR